MRRAPVHDGGRACRRYPDTATGRDIPHPRSRIDRSASGLPSRAGSHEESAARSDKEKAQPCTHATRPRGDFRRPFVWTVSLSELNLAAKLFSALARQHLEQIWIHDGFLSWKQDASDTTCMSRHTTRRHRRGRVGTRGVAKRLDESGAAERAQRAASVRAPVVINVRNWFIKAPPSRSWKK
jgi:hypothetical protein